MHSLQESIQQFTEHQTSVMARPIHSISFTSEQPFPTALSRTLRNSLLWSYGVTAMRQVAQYQ